MCHYGDIKGTSFAITAPQLINTAGLICATESGLRSVLNVKSVKHVRDEEVSYSVRGCPGHPWRKKHTFQGDSTGTKWCGGLGCNPRSIKYETSGEAILFAQGDLDVTYETLEMLAHHL